MVIDKTKKLAKRFPKLILGRNQDVLSAEHVEPARTYIEKHWRKLTRYTPHDKEGLIGLPNAYLVPAVEKGHEFDFNEMYYWDSYFMVQGMLDDEHKELVTGILDNLFFMFEKFKIIPNASRTYLAGRSQPPLLTTFIMDVYKTYKLDNAWLRKAVSIAKKEYEIVWMGETKPNARQVYRGLSRYYDINYLNDLAEAESGWDYTPRFKRRCLDYLPVDLNSLLYKYEKDFAEAGKILGNAEEEKKWKARASSRKEVMNELMWSKSKGLYFDYNYKKESRGGVMSLAAFYPMWAGLASPEQAKVLVKSLKRFMNDGGLATTDTAAIKQYIPGAFPTQWAFPNGWAPLHFIVAQGLRRYGYDKEAENVARAWLRCNLNWFNKHGVFLEKYNVVDTGKPPLKGVYPSQVGFGWTNAIFERFCRDFIDAKEKPAI